MAKKIVCPNCKLPIDEGSKTCQYCGAEITEKIEVDENAEAVEEASEQKAASSKKKLPAYYLFFIIAAGLSVLSFLLPILPTAVDYAHPIYTITFGAPFNVGMNAATICFVFSVVTLLCFAAIHWSIYKKTTEIALFGYFAAFIAQLSAVFAGLAPVLLSSGNADRTFGFSIGFLVMAIFYEAIVVFTILAIIQYIRL